MARGIIFFLNFLKFLIPYIDQKEELRFRYRYCKIIKVFSDKKLDK